MSKEAFVNEIKSLIETGTIELSEEAAKFFDSWTAEKNNGELSDGAKAIIDYMRADGKDSYSAKMIADGLFIASVRSVSGSMRKLVTTGYVTKSGADPVMYTLVK